ncbi:MAG: cation diffusion facilitator family transporter, partial [Gammaproteobacteria bacterium]|nr:cation diffusion facilitator family transporter [Gammaproteobacteria bacterium]
ASIIAKEWLYFITKKRATEIRSNLLVANAWHHRSDSLSSILVLLGVGGAMMGVTWLEMVAAIGVALMIGQIGWSLGKQSMDELVDTALSQADVDELKKTVMAAEGVRGVHNIRTRKMGNDVLLDVHLQVNPAVSVSEGHHIGEWVTRDLLLRFDFLADIIVHIDAEDDELVEVRELSEYEIPPLRHDVRLTLMTCWKDFIDPEDVLKLTLHYLNRGINAELYLPMDKYGANASELHQQLLQAASNVKWLRRLNIWFA